jgi:hypothetical protein
LVCCSHSARDTRDANGVKVHSAACNALAPAPPTAREADERAGPELTEKPAADPLSRRLAALERQDIEDALHKRAAAASLYCCKQYMTVSGLGREGVSCGNV